VKLRALALLFVCGCTTTGGGEADLSPAPEDGGLTLDDAHLAPGCVTQSDCDDNNPCTTEVCGIDHKCTYTDKDCISAGDECNLGICDPKSGDCTVMAANDTGVCGVTTGTPGHCNTGVCVPDPMCNVGFSSIGCYSYNMVRTGITTGASAIDTYSCATGETGPEMAFPLYSSTDRVIKLTLSNTTVDLDLLVLDGNLCVPGAACVAKGVTAGSGNESVTFAAKANHNYTVVVDGQGGAAGAFTLTAACASCAPIQALACNQTLMGDTTHTSATNGLNGYQCATGENGAEESYSINQTSDTNYKLTLSGLSQDLDLLVLGDSSGQCDPTSCRAQSLTAGTADETVSFTGLAGTTYYAVVDGKGTGSAYQLAVDCPPSCRNTANYLSCTTPSDARRNDDPVRSKSTVDSWVCDAGTTGPEVVYYFYASTAGMYTVDLTGLTDDLDLIVVAGTYSSCDPTQACVGSSVHPLTADESVTFAATQGQYYWIAVDGKNGATSPYTLKLRSSACPAPTCYQSGNKLSCSYLDDWRRNDDANHSKNAIDGWACDANTTGPEVIYQFKPPASGAYTVTLDGLAADLDLLVLSSTSSFSCDSMMACVASGTTSGTATEVVPFTADASLYYYLAVDGKAGAVSPYHINLSSSLCPAPTCANASHSLSCTLSSRSLSDQNDQPGSTSDVSTWACATGETGPERVHLFTPSGPGPYTIELIGLTADLDLLVLEAPAALTCDPTAACVTQSITGGTADEKVTFTADPTKKYWIVVDGKNGAISAYTLAITAGCP
jgi:hypothetical protein